MKKLKEIYDSIGDEQLSDRNTLPKPEEFSKSGNIEEDFASDFKATLGLTGKASVSLINSSSESEQVNDPEGVFLAPKYTGDNADDLNNLLDPHPVIKLPSNAAYLRYALGVDFNAEGSGELGPIGINVKSKLAWQASYYSRHSINKTIKNAFTDDLGITDSEDSWVAPASNLLSLFRSGDAEANAKVGDVLTFSSAGSISGSIEIDAAELLTGAIAFSGLFDKVIPITYSAGASVKVSTSFSGDFFVAVAIKPSNKLEIVVRRAGNRLSSGGVSFGAKAKIDLSAATDLVTGYLKQITDATDAQIKSVNGKVDALLQSAKESVDFDKFFGDLTGPEGDLLKKWYDKLVGKVSGGLDDFIDGKLDTIIAPLEKLNKILKGWSKAIEEYSEVSLSLALSYEVAKLETTADLFRFECTRAAFADFRRDLLLFRFDSILDAAQDSGNESVSIKRFLNAKISKKTKNFSLVLKIGDWSFGGNFTDEIKWVELMDRSDLDNPYIKHAAFIGGRNYEVYGGLDSMNYGFTFEGAFKGNSAGGLREPDISDLAYTCGAQMSFHEDELSETKLLELLDYGIVSGAIDRDGRFDAATDISLSQINGVKIGRTADISIGLVASGVAARALIAYLADAPLADRVQAMCNAMYRWEGMAGRERLSERLLAYSDVWENVLTKINFDTDVSTKRKLNQALLGNAYSDLYRKEDRHWDHPGSGFYRKSLHSILVRDGVAFSKVINNFNVGIKELNRQINSVGYDSYRNLEEQFELIRRPWKRDFSSRWMIALLHIGAQKVISSGVSKDLIEYRFVIKQGNTVIPVTPESIS